MTEPNIEKQAVEFLRRINDALDVAEGAAPHTWELLLQSVRVEAIGDLITGTLWLMFGLITLALSIYGMQKAKTDGEISVIVSLFIVFGVGPVFISLSFLADIWTWVGITNPELWIANEATSKLLK